jgi:phosphate transport system substrate-binding protein
VNGFRLGVLIIALVGLDCTRGGNGSSITIAGSTSVQPFAEMLAEIYMKQNPKIRINVQGGGSSAGIQAVESGACAIGTSSRNLKPEEKSLYSTLIARDGIVIVINRNNPVTDLSLDEIRGIFTGRIKNWSEVGGTNKPITPITREEGSGTRGSFQDLVMGKEFFSDDALVQDSNGSIREIVASDPAAIGYISYGLIDSRVKALSISGVTPTIETMAAGRYNLVRPFLFVVKIAPAGTVKNFIDFVLSPEGQRALKSEGLIALQ